jgi:hypothetical protein
MIRRLIGLLILIALIIPPLAVAAGVILVRDVTGRVESELELRINNVRAELTDVEEAVEDVRSRMTDLVTPINGAVTSIGNLIDDVEDLIAGNLTIPGVVLTDFILGIPGIGTFTIVIPNIPSTTLTIPGLSSLRGLFEDTLGELEDTASAVSAVLRLRFIPNQLNQAAADIRALTDYITGVGASIAAPVQILLWVCGAWVVVVYIIALYLGLGTGWRMLTGR